MLSTSFYWNENLSSDTIGMCNMFYLISISFLAFILKTSAAVFEGKMLQRMFENSLFWLQNFIFTISKYKMRGKVRKSKSSTEFIIDENELKFYK